MLDLISTAKALTWQEQKSYAILIVLAVILFINVGISIWILIKSRSVK